MNKNDNIISAVQKKDLRILKTEKAIKDAFLDLLKKNKYAKITVNDIAMNAMINRNTFYLHYVDKDDLLDNILIDELGYYAKTLAKHIILFTQFKSDNYKKQFKDTLVEAMKKMRESEIFMKSYTKDIDFKNHIEKLTEQSRYNLIKFYDNYDNEIKLKIEFTYNGSLGLLYRWMQSNGEFAKIEDIAELITLNLSSLLEYF